MKKNHYTFLILLAIVFVLHAGCKPEGKKSSGITQNDNIRLVSLPDEHKVDIFIDSIYFTSYIYPDNMEKPVLYPLNSSSGIPVTRGFPIYPKPNERIDHPHQTGMWFNYGNVNGLDFWNN